MARCATWVRVSAFVAAGLSLQACSTLGYYLQSVQGQMEVLAKRRPLAAVIADEAESDTTRKSLRLVQQLRRFAVTDLALPDNKSYQSYSDLGRPYVVYNVFATPELSLEPVQSCFLVVGCLDYRGYFQEERANGYAVELQEAGHDVFVGGIAAYSTLGWFDDPVLNSMLYWHEGRIARFIFHELAHQQLYVRNDTSFNEAFAETVAEIGLQRWLETPLDPARADAIRVAEHREQQFIELVLDVKTRLQKVYAMPLAEAGKRTRKESVLGGFRRDYLQLKAGWGGDSSYDAWALNHVNNAKISAVVTYHEDVPAFRALLRRTDGDMAKFYALAAQIGELAPTRRRQCIDALKRRGERAVASAPCGSDVPTTLSADP